MAVRLDFSSRCGTAPPTFTEWVRVRSRRQPSCSEKLVALLYILRAFSADDQCTPNRPPYLASIGPQAAPAPSVFWSGVHPGPLRLTVAAEQLPAHQELPP